MPPIDYKHKTAPNRPTVNAIDKIGSPKTKSSSLILFTTLSLASLDGMTFSTPIGKLRLLHVIIPIFFLIACYYTKPTLKNIFSTNLPILSTIICFTLTSALGEQHDSTTSTIINMWINFFIFVSVFILTKSITNANDIFKIEQIAYIQILLSLILVACQFVLSYSNIYHPVGYSQQGLFALGRPAAFFVDANWLGIWVFGLVCIVMFQHRHSKQSTRLRKSLLSAVMIFIIIQSRIGIAMTMLYTMLTSPRSKRKLLFASFFILFIIVIFNYHLLPSNLYYDIIDTEQNPRIYDALTILNNIDTTNIMFGHGLGSIPDLNQIQRGREFSAAINVLPIQILYEFGILGITALVAGATWIIISLRKRHHTLLFFILLSTCMLFHNSIYKQYFWVILAIMLALPSQAIPKSRANA